YFLHHGMPFRLTYRGTRVLSSLCLLGITLLNRQASKRACTRIGRGFRAVRREAPKHREELMNPRKLVLLSWTGALMASAAFIPSVAHAAPKCTELQAQLLANSDITAATSVLTAAAGSNLAYCQVNITVSDLAGPENGYQVGQKQQI